MRLSALMDGCLMRKSMGIVFARWLLFVTIGGCLHALPAIGQNTSSLLEQGRTQYDAQQYEAAEETLRSLLEQESKSVMAHFWLGRILDAQGRYKDAEKAIKNALKIDNTLIEGHIELAKVYIHREKDKDARKALDKAEELDSENADIPYHRGLTYGKIKLGIFRRGKVKKEFEQRHDSFQRAIELNPEHPDAYFQLGYTFETTNGDLDLALPWYYKQASVTPDHHQAMYRLAAGAIRLEQYQRGFGLFQQLAGRYDVKTYPIIQAMLGRLEAYFYHAQNKHDRAYSAYEKYMTGLESVDPVEAALYKNLSQVASEEEVEAYQMASAEEKQALWRTYWAARDPDPTTVLNERLAEHYRRVMFSRRHFSEGKEPWDRRGDIYIRFGEPDDRQHFLLQSGEDVVFNIFPTSNQHVDAIRDQNRQRYRMRLSTGASDWSEDGFLSRASRETRAVSFPTESWVYVPFGLELFFSDQMNSGEFDYPLQTIELPSAGSNFGETNRLAQQFLNTPRKQAEELIKKVPESFRYDYGGEQLTFVYDMVSFKGADHQAEIEVAYSIPSNQLGHAEDGLGMQTWFNGRVALRDEHLNHVKASAFSMGPVARPMTENEAVQLQTAAFSFQVPAGTFRSSMAVRDSVSKRFGIYTSPLAVTDYSTPELHMSDIKLSSSIVPTDQTNLFVRNGLYITPHPARMYPQQAPVFIYYELYNLTPDAEGRTAFQTDIEITAKEEQRGFAWRLLTSLGRLITQSEDEQSVFLTYEDGGIKSDEYKYTSIDTSDSPAGTYSLTLTITDLNSNQKTTKFVDFVVVEN
jgi:GWxTD domain-containing protein